MAALMRVVCGMYQFSLQRHEQQDRSRRRRHEQLTRRVCPVVRDAAAQTHGAVVELACESTNTP
jgi:hypothetical protein